jgi:hypothetical protein
MLKVPVTHLPWTRVVSPGGVGQDPVGSPSAADDGRWDMSIGIGIFLMVLGAILALAVETDVPGVNVNALGVILLLIGLVAVGYSLLFWSSLTPWGRRRIIARRRMVGPDQPLDEGPFDDRLP